MIELDQIKGFFLKGMAQGWAAGKDKPHRGMPFHRMSTYKEGNLTLIDSWIVIPGGDRSAGSTIISSEGMPVWIMHYGGRYEKEALPCVRAALLKAYSNKRWFRGRGEPGVYDGLKYKLAFSTTNPDAMTFGGFRGDEQVLDGKRRKLGNYWFHGMSLI